MLNLQLLNYQKEKKKKKKKRGVLIVELIITNYL